MSNLPLIIAPLFPIVMMILLLALLGLSKIKYKLMAYNALTTTKNTIIDVVKYILKLTVLILCISAYFYGKANM